MTTTAVAAGNRAAHALTLGANTEDRVQFADNITGVRVLITAVSGTAPIYLSLDGTAATVAGPKTTVMLAVVGAESVLELAVGTDEIRLISAGAHTYSVESY